MSTNETPSEVEAIIEWLAKDLTNHPSPQVMAIERVLVNVVAVVGGIIGVVRPDLQKQLGDIPQTALIIASALLLFAYNGWMYAVAHWHWAKQAEVELKVLESLVSGYHPAPVTAMIVAPLQ